MGLLYPPHDQIHLRPRPPGVFREVNNWRIIDRWINEIASWSRDSRKLLSASTDNHISIWDILTGDAEETFRLPCPVLKVQFHPRDSTKILVCPLRHAPVILNTVSYQRSILQFEDDVKALHGLGWGYDGVFLQNDLGIAASFDRRGTYIFTGNSKGKVSCSDFVMYCSIGRLLWGALGEWQSASMT